MTNLEHYVHQRIDLPPSLVMDILQTRCPAGTVSDNCLTLADVGNAGRVIAYLESHPSTFPQHFRR